MEKALVYTVVAGSRACPNNCDICISKMTPSHGIETSLPVVDWATFDKATDIAVNYGAKYFLITSKGEATLFPAQVAEYLHRVENKPFIRRELQTEGSTIAHGGLLYNEFLKTWKNNGLDLIAISIYHYDDFKNHELFKSKNPMYSLEKLIKKIKENKINVRLSCVMLKGSIDSILEVSKLIEFCKKNGVFQLTLRMADSPKKSLNKKVTKYVNDNKTSNEFVKEVVSFLDSKGTLCDVLPHGALVYEIDGQNVAISTGLSTKFKKTKNTFDKTYSNNDVLRQLIFLPPSMLTASWENIYGGRIL